MQTLIQGKNCSDNIGQVLKKTGCKKILTVCGNSFKKLPIKNAVENSGIPYVYFSDFSPNPKYEDICRGVEVFNKEKCDAVLAVGGGSAMDTAKCIKLFCKMNRNENYLLQEYKDTEIPLIAVPTTAGTGSESTRFAVIYHKGEKQSVTHDSIIPDVALLDSSLLKNLPLYQKKCTFLDALCQAAESWWSVKSTDESMGYSKEAIDIMLKNYRPYLDGDENAAEKIMLASNLAGRAINITQTTAAHAMSYKLTSLYGIPHGHAVAVCMAELLALTAKSPEPCADPRGTAYFLNTLDCISRAFGGKNAEDAAKIFKNLLSELGIENPKTNKPEDIAVLTLSVNTERLGNNPVMLDKKTLQKLYEKIVEVEK